MESRKTILGIVLDRMRRNPLLADVPFETVVDYAVDFMRIEGFPALFKAKEVHLDIKDFRALLPFDCSEVKAVRLSEGAKPRFRYAGETFNREKDGGRFDLTYKVQGSVIYTSIENGGIDVAYSAIETDDSGFPLIPDDTHFIKALEDYIKVQHFTILFELGKLQLPVLQHAEQEYCWSVASLESKMHHISVDEAESIGNQWRQILINDKAHIFDYKDLGKRKEFNIV